MDAGYGSGAVCRLCEQPIDHDHIGYEVTDARDGSSLLFHLTCHRAWQLECADKALPRPHGIERRKCGPLRKIDLPMVPLESLGAEH